jgi:DNA helicase HerA-like ATPase
MGMGKIEILNQVWIGRTGSGKTWSAIDEALRLSAEGRPIILIDPKNEASYNPSNPSRERDWPGIQTDIVSDIDLDESTAWTVHIEDHEREQLLILSEYLKFRQDQNWSDGPVVIVDEIDVFSGIHRLDPALKNLSVRGRGYGISLISLTQRPQMCHTTIFTQASVIRLFYIAPRDRQHIEGVCAIDLPPIPAKGSYQYVEIGSDGEIIPRDARDR